MEITTQQIKDLRAETGVGILDCRKALLDADGNFDQALAELREKGLATALKRADRETSEGYIELYSHGDGRVGVMVEVNCETDFVASSENFRNFVHEIALQIAAGAPQFISPDDVPEQVLEDEREKARQYALAEGKPENVIDRIVEGRLKKFLDDACLLRQTYVRDDEMIMEQLLMQNIASLGENVVIQRFERWELGEQSSTE